jgi:hypothetical protein
MSQENVEIVLQGSSLASSRLWAASVRSKFCVFLCHGAQGRVGLRARRLQDLILMQRVIAPPGPRAETH